MRDDLLGGGNAGPSLLEDDEDSDPMDDVQAMQQRMAIGLACGGCVGVAAAVAAYLLAVPSIGVWAIALALLALVVVGYVAAAVFASLAAFVIGGGL